MFKLITRKRNLKMIASFLAVNLLVSSVMPPVAYALTSGPSQPEVQSFKPVGTSDMVNLFSGDFSYNIPLFELPGPNGGYPFNLAYNGGIGMDQEASWVGLGWNLNPGAINRQMRGLPDEFKGDEVVKEMYSKPNISFGGGIAGSVELAGFGDVSVPLNLIYNNYRGIGTEIGLGLSFESMDADGLTAGLDLNLTASSKDGLSISPSVSLSQKEKDKENKYKTISSTDIGFSFNTMSGLQQMTYGISVPNVAKHQFGDRVSLSFASPAYAPQVTMPYHGINLDFELKGGAENLWFYKATSGSIFFQLQKLKTNVQKTKAYGYLHYQDISNEEVLLDINREKDVTIRERMPNLACPSLTSDIFTVTGQGISAMYRPYRRDIGTVFDTKMTSTSAGISLGVDVGGGNAAKVGFTLGLNGSLSQSKKWTASNDLEKVLSFKKKSMRLGDMVYFKSHGELSSNVFDASSTYHKFKGERAIRPNLRPFFRSVTANIDFDFDSGTKKEPVTSNLLHGDEESLDEFRNTAIVPITNDELFGGSNNDQVVLGEYDFTFIDQDGQEKSYTSEIRKNHKGHHMAGYSSVNQGGTRYVFGLPAYNKSQAEHTYSVKVDQFKTVVDNVVGNYKDAKDWSRSVNRTPEYAYAYLLTSVLGTDYVDADDIPGPSKGDLGYWIKFNYKRVEDNYKWRSPFTGGKYNSGLKDEPKDDKASFTYGEKEIWNLYSVESASHIALFTTANREDGRGAFNEYQDDSNKLGAYQQKLKKISIYTQLEYEENKNDLSNAVPLKKVLFTYADDDNSLCQGIDNHTSRKGKLTLESLAFEYGTSSRGSMNPYQFEYYTSYGENLNYDYKNYRMDRWGNYKYEPNFVDNNGDDIEEDYFDFPYLNQYNEKTIHNIGAQAWQLKSITLPSGGKIDVEYEADDYAYVQNKKAMFMADVDGFENQNTEVSISHIGNNELYQKKKINNRIYFKLKKPIAASRLETPDAVKKEALKYIDQETMQLYFKMPLTLQKPELNSIKDVVAGYATIKTLNDEPDVGLVLNGDNYTHGYVTIENGKNKLKTADFNVISIVGWQHIQSNRPHLTTPRVEPIKSSDSNKTKVKKILGFLTPAQLAHIQQIGGFYGYARKRRWCQKVDLSKAMIRLNIPDGIKYGGGSRVKKVSLTDGWEFGQTKAATYGQVYEYTKEENGELISSGVAAYEPLFGGDEIALRHAKRYREKVAARNDNSFFFEYPINESYFPGAQVGYSQVTIKSIASADAKNYAADGINRIGFHSTTGITVHEFYTAKDFPVLTEETPIYKVPGPVINLSFLTSFTENRYTATQGYSVVLNDMHGKPKSVTNYGQKENGTRKDKPISWVKYTYHAREKSKNGKIYHILENEVPTLKTGTKNLTGDVVLEQNVNRTLGVDYEIFADARESTSSSFRVNLQGNLDFTVAGIIPAVSITAFPTIKTSYREARTMVINKVVNKVGLLDKVEAFTDGALTVTENLLWDERTGEVVLTSVNTSYEDGEGMQKIYSYNIPAYIKYKGMGAASDNLGMEFTGTFKGLPKNPDYYVMESAKELNGTEITDFGTDLYAGDEFIVDHGEGKAIYVGKKKVRGEDGTLKSLHAFYSKNNALLSGEDLAMFLYRSGKRNLLGAKVGNITALADPTKASREDGVIPKQIRLKVPAKTNN